MNSFFATIDTIDKYQISGFNHFGLEHIIWLLVFVVFSILLCILYKKGCSHDCKTNCPRHANETHTKITNQNICRHEIRMIIALLLVADELLKYLLIAANGAPFVKYLPLQLCSLCIIIVVIHAFLNPRSKGAYYLGNFLYLIGIASGLSAILFPSWTSLPAFNLMSIHSFSAHILLVSYIIMILIGKELEISAKTIPISTISLFIMACGIFIFNMSQNTNYMYLMHISPGSPLIWFEALGDYRIGYVVILIGLIIVLYGVRFIVKQLRKNKYLPKIKKIL